MQVSVWKINYYNFKITIQLKNQNVYGTLVWIMYHGKVHVCNELGSHVYTEHGSRDKRHKHALKQVSNKQTNEGIPG